MQNYVQSSATLYSVSRPITEKWRGAFPSLGCVPQPQATRHRPAEQLGELSMLFNDVLLETSCCDAAPLRIIYYAFRAVSWHTSPDLSHENNSEILLASVPQGPSESQRTWQLQPVWPHNIQHKSFLEQSSIGCKIVRCCGSRDFKDVLWMSL